MALARLGLLLFFGYTVACAAVPAWASLIVPPLDAVARFESLEAAASHAPKSAPAQDPPRRNWQRSLPIAVHLAGGQQSTGGAGSSNSSTNAPGSHGLATCDHTAVLSDSPAVAWLREGSWLAVPMPTGVELLRPPQVV